MVLRNALGWVARLWIRHHMLLLTFINVNVSDVGFGSDFTCLPDYFECDHIIMKLK